MLSVLWLCVLYFCTFCRLGVFIKASMCWWPHQSHLVLFSFLPLPITWCSTPVNRCPPPPLSALFPLAAMLSRASLLDVQSSVNIICMHVFFMCFHHTFASFCVGSHAFISSINHWSITHILRLRTSSIQKIFITGFKNCRDTAG